MRWPGMRRIRYIELTNAKGKTMKMSMPWSQLPANKLPGFPLSLYEHLTHTARGLEANFMGNMARISRNVLRSTLRYAH